MKNDSDQEETSKTNDSTEGMVHKQQCDIDIDSIILSKRFSRNELVLRLLSLLCLVVMVCLFFIQLDLLWRQRESFIMELVLSESPDFYFRYPEFYDIPHDEETWCWDPDTLLLKVNTSLFVH